MTFRPKSPKESSEPRQALPRMRPRCDLRYFTFLGINMFVVPQILFALPKPSALSLQPSATLEPNFFASSIRTVRTIPDPDDGYRLMASLKMLQRLPLAAHASSARGSHLCRSST